jgi:hypothetical protein
MVSFFVVYGFCGFRRCGFSSVALGGVSRLIDRSSDCRCQCFPL